jgi:hypothetical protein
MSNIGLNIDHAARRAGRYWEIDGLPRISLGLLGVLMASLCLWMSHIHALFRHTPIFVFSLLIVVAYIYLLDRTNSPVMRWLKARITYPRTGYVLSQSKNMGPYPESWIFALAGLPGLFERAWIGAILLAVATSILWRVTRGRFQYAGIVIPGYYLCEVLLAVLPTAQDYRIWYMFIAFSLVDAFAGVIQLATYLRQHPVAQT